MSRVADPTTRISLLRAAEEVFAKKGLEAAKVEDIAKRAGCSKGAFYLHFEGKEEAFLQVVESFLARCDGMVAEPADLPDSAGSTSIAIRRSEIEPISHSASPIMSAAKATGSA